MAALGSPSGIFDVFTTAQLNQLVASGFDRTVFGQIEALAGQNHSSTTRFDMSLEKMLQEAQFILRKRGIGCPAPPTKVYENFNRDCPQSAGSVTFSS